MIDPKSPKYELPTDWLSWTGGIGAPAGIFLLDGRSHIAAHGSPAEDWLLERGALLVASLRFEADPHERTHRGRTVERLTIAEALLEFGVTRGNRGA